MKIFLLCVLVLLAVLIGAYLYRVASRADDFRSGVRVERDLHQGDYFAHCDWGLF